MNQSVFHFAIEYQTVILADRNDIKIAKGQVALLGALLKAKDNCGSLDDATADLTKAFDDQGKWRGSICLGLCRDGLIAEVGAVNSRRVSRNRGLMRRWRLVDADKATKRIKALHKWIQSIENPQTAPPRKGGEQ